MRYTEFTRTLVEAVDQIKTVTKHDVEQTLRKAGYEDFKVNGNKINVLVQIPSGQQENEFRVSMLEEILTILKMPIKQMPIIIFIITNILTRV